MTNTASAGLPETDIDHNGSMGSAVRTEDGTRLVNLFVARNLWRDRIRRLGTGHGPHQTLPSILRFPRLSFAIPFGFAHGNPRPPT